MAKITVKKFASFAEEEAAERAEYRSMTSSEKLELIARLRALRHGPDDATAPRLERILTITELARS